MPSELDTFEHLKYQIVVDDNETIYYYNCNNELDREDGPAVIMKCGRSMWYQRGFRHRENGPAIIWEDGVGWWYLYGNRLTEQQFNDWKEQNGK